MPAPGKEIGGPNSIGQISGVRPSRQTKESVLPFLPAGTALELRPNAEKEDLKMAKRPIRAFVDRKMKIVFHSAKVGPAPKKGQGSVCCVRSKKESEFQAQIFFPLPVKKSPEVFFAANGDNQQSCPSPHPAGMQPKRKNAQALPIDSRGGVRRQRLFQSSRAKPWAPTASRVSRVFTGHLSASHPGYCNRADLPTSSSNAGARLHELSKREGRYTKQRCPGGGTQEARPLRATGSQQSAHMAFFHLQTLGPL